MLCSRWALRTLHTWSNPRYTDIINSGAESLLKGSKFSQKLSSWPSIKEYPNQATSNLHRILSTLPQTTFAFGYGSGVVRQLGYAANASPQIDLILAVSNPMQWHRQNMSQNPGHYSLLSMLGAAGVTAIQRLGAGVYFNPYVQIAGQIVKYGVVDIETVTKDLTEWNTLYIAGRLQKPVEVLVHDEKVEIAYEYNLQLILNLGVILLTQTSVARVPQFSEVELYEIMASVSYMGDIRILLGGENPNKVRNIVEKQHKFFSKLYQPYLDRLIHEEILIEVSDMKEKQFRLGDVCLEDGIKTLPKAFRQLAKHNIDLKSAILNTIRYPSIIQTGKGLFTAGILKSAKYALEKRSKGKSK